MSLPQRRGAARIDAIVINNSSETFTPTASGAIATHVWETVNAAHRQGVSVHVVTRQSVEAKYEWPYISFTRPIPKLPTYGARGARKLLRTRDVGFPGYALDVLRELRRLDSSDRIPIILHNDPELALVLSLRRPTGTVLHMFHNELHLRRPWNRILGSRRALRHAAVSAFLTQRIVAQSPSHSHIQISTIHNGVNLQQFEPAPRPVTLRSTPIIGFLGRTGREKGLDVLLDACILLAEEGHSLGVKIIGSNHWGERILDSYQVSLDNRLEILRDLNITIDQTGHLPRSLVARELQDLTALVVPSRWQEPFALVALEGMACGVPVIASAIGGLPEVLSDAGVLFKAEDVRSLARKLSDLFGNPELHADLSRKSIARAREFTWDKTWSLMQIAGQVGCG